MTTAAPTAAAMTAAAPIATLSLTVQSSTPLPAAVVETTTPQESTTANVTRPQDITSTASASASASASMTSPSSPVTPDTVITTAAPATIIEINATTGAPLTTEEPTTAEVATAEAMNLTTTDDGYPFGDPVIKRYILAQLGKISDEEKSNYQKRLFNYIAGRMVFPIPPEISTTYSAHLLAQIRGKSKRHIQFIKLNSFNAFLFVKCARPDFPYCNYLQTIDE